VYIHKPDVQYFNSRISPKIAYLSGLFFKIFFRGGEEGGGACPQTSLKVCASHFAECALHTVQWPLSQTTHAYSRNFNGLNNSVFLPSALLLDKAHSDWYMVNCTVMFVINYTDSNNNNNHFCITNPLDFSSISHQIILLRCTFLHFHAYKYLRITL